MKQTKRTDPKAKPWIDPKDMEVGELPDVSFDAVLESYDVTLSCKGKEVAHWCLFGVKITAKTKQSYRILFTEPAPELPGDGRVVIDPSCSNNQIVVGERGFTPEIKKVLKKAADECVDRRKRKKGAPPLRINFEPKYSPKFGHYITELKVVPSER